MYGARIAWLGALVSGLCLAGPSMPLANDTMATFGAGGLQFQQTSEIRMEREELYLSPLEVRVAYVFRNLTDHDVRMTVAFPMPDIDVYGMSETPHEFHLSSREGDIFDFHVHVNGVEIVSNFIARAYRADQPDKEVTELLKKYKMPLLAESMARPPEKTDTKALIAEGLIDDELLHPNWIVKTNFHWEQVFPAGRTVNITHRYKPVVGGSYMGTELTAHDLNDRFAPWCPDQAFVKAASALPARDGTVPFQTLEYVLKTGANWAGPIGKFRLEIDKAGADLVSLCPIPGLKLRRRGQSFVAEASQYVPTTDIKLLFAYRACDKAPCGLDANWPGFPRR